MIVLHCLLFQDTVLTVAYPELVSGGGGGGGYKSRKFKRLVKVGASKGVTPGFKKNHGQWGVSGQPENPPGYATAPVLYL